MMLLIDVGNSCLKYALAESETGKIHSHYRICYNDDNLAKKLRYTWSTMPNPHSVWVSNVVGKKITKILKKEVKSRWAMPITFAKSTAYACSIHNGYDNPKRLGTDRWMALIGARALKTGTLCVVDCGTAVTLDVLSTHNEYLGGVIVAGMESMRRALLKDTHAPARYCENAENVDIQALGKNTLSGIQLGSLYAIVGLIEWMVNRLEKQGEKPQLILTGGSAPALLPLLTIPYYFSSDLVLRGLFVLAHADEHNQ